MLLGQNVMFYIFITVRLQILLSISSDKIFLKSKEIKKYM